MLFDVPIEIACSAIKKISIPGDYLRIISLTTDETPFNCNEVFRNRTEKISLNSTFDHATNSSSGATTLYQHIFKPHHVKK